MYYNPSYTTFQAYKKKKNTKTQLGMVAQTFNPNPWEADAGRSVTRPAWSISSMVYIEFQDSQG